MLDVKITFTVNRYWLLVLTLVILLSKHEDLHVRLYLTFCILCKCVNNASGMLHCAQGGRDPLSFILSYEVGIWISFLLLLNNAFRNCYIVQKEAEICPLTKSIFEV